MPLIVTAPFNVSAYSAVVLADNPVIYLKLDESAGATAVDSTGNGWDGTYQNTLPRTGTKLVNDPSPFSQDFIRGNSDYISLSTIPIVGGSGARTAEIWMNSDILLIGGAFSEAAAFHIGNTGSNGQAFFISCVAGPNIRFGLWGGAEDDDIPQAYQNNTLHIVYSYTGTTKLGWINGTQVLNRVQGANTGGTWFTVGRRGSPEHYWDGRLDHFSYYNYAVDQTWVDRHYQAGL